MHAWILWLGFSLFCREVDSRHTFRGSNDLKDVGGFFGGDHN